MNLPRKSFLGKQKEGNKLLRMLWIMTGFSVLECVYVHTVQQELCTQVDVDAAVEA